MTGRLQPSGPAFNALTPRRVALFTGAYNHIADGVSLTLNRLVGYLEKHDVAVRVFAPTIPNPPLQHNGTLIPVPSIQMPGRPEYLISTRLSARARTELDAFAPTLYHVATPDVLGLAALHRARRKGIPVVASYHTHFSSYLKYYRPISWLEGALWWHLRRFYRQCTQVYVPTPSMEAVLRDHGITERLYLWPRGVETQLYTPDRRSSAWRRSMGFGDDEVVVTFVSRLVWEKGLHPFAEVIETLKARGIPHRSLIVGDGPARDELVQRLPDARFTGHLTGSALATAYASSDVFLFPSETETFGNVTLEAMSSGLPTVCADATGSRSLVKDGVTGYLAPPGDAPAFVERTVRLVTNGALRRNMGAQARSRAMEFDWENVLALMLSYYDQVLNPGVPIPPPSSTPATPGVSEQDVIAPMFCSSS